MGKNSFFNNFGNSQEQELLDNLIRESIGIVGQTMMYVPRVLHEIDQIYLQDTSPTYDRAIPIDVYVKSFSGFEGDGNFLSRLGLEIRDQISLSLSISEFGEEIGIPMGLPRPREDDLIYFPLNRKCFQIRFVDNKPWFYQLGALQMYDLTCEVFEYSNEVLQTGIPEIDSLMKRSLDVYEWTLEDESGDLLTDENGIYLVDEAFSPEVIDPLEDEATLLDNIGELIDFSTENPFGEPGL